MRALAVAWGIVLLFASTGAAQTEADADELLREGVAFAQAGDHARAVAWLERARAIAPSDRIDLNLAESLVALADFRRAEAILQRLANDAAVNPLIGEVARERLAALHERMGVVVVSVSPVPEGAWLTIDGRRSAEASAVSELRVPPGTVRLAIVGRDGTVLARGRATVEERGRANVELAPVVVAPEREPPRPRARRSRGPLVPAPPPASFDPWPWIGGAIAVVVALAAGIGIGAAIWAPMDADLGASALGSP